MENAFVLAEYIWIGGNNELRSKSRTLKHNKWTVENLPEWDYDGSSTNQAETKHSEVILKPKSLFPCPFRRGGNLLVLCDTYKPDGTPLENNYRHTATKIFNKGLNEKPWFGLEQEFFIIDPKTKKPFGLTEDKQEQGQFYCGIGTTNVFNRVVIERLYSYCLFAMINISGINAEVAPGQWEYQIGPNKGIDSADQLWISRYILLRISEDHNVEINFEAKLLSKDEWNGSGCHVNYSTQSMRDGNGDKTGLDIINEAINKLSLKHTEHMKVYGTGNELRMTGLNETAKYDEFSSGVGNRGASVRIPTNTEKNKCGYFEDRRPAANIDPYLVTSMIFETATL